MRAVTPREEELARRARRPRDPRRARHRVGRAARFRVRRARRFSRDENHPRPRAAPSECGASAPLCSLGRQRLVVVQEPQAWPPVSARAPEDWSTPGPLRGGPGGFREECGHSCPPSLKWRRRREDPGMKRARVPALPSSPAAPPLFLDGNSRTKDPPFMREFPGRSLPARAAFCCKKLRAAITS